ncbi:hypothetical protein NDU88_001662 [Pleurodeles waltl]|uniref:Uncharacterized protein n=1 Tax=Pleurodeles waltl TaxID=8319 RepID=A0AAV7T0A2_PLEWA|nr:hypothetical protein NDU88_001662 [Pleurodeles waltl]
MELNAPIKRLKMGEGLVAAHAACRDRPSDSCTECCRCEGCAPAVCDSPRTVRVKPEITGCSSLPWDSHVSAAGVTALGLLIQLLKATTAKSLQGSGRTRGDQRHRPMGCHCL